MNKDEVLISLIEKFEQTYDKIKVMANEIEVFNDILKELNGKLDILELYKEEDAATLERLNNLVMHFKNINDEFNKKTIEIEKNLANSYTAIDGSINLTKDKVKKISALCEEFISKTESSFQNEVLKFNNLMYKTQIMLNNFNEELDKVKDKNSEIEFTCQDIKNIFNRLDDLVQYNKYLISQLTNIKEEIEDLSSKGENINKLQEMIKRIDNIYEKSKSFIEDIDIYTKNGIEDAEKLLKKLDDLMDKISNDINDIKIKAFNLDERLSGFEKDLEIAKTFFEKENNILSKMYELQSKLELLEELDNKIKNISERIDYEIEFNKSIMSIFNEIKETNSDYKEFFYSLIRDWAKENLPSFLVRKSK